MYYHYYHVPVCKDMRLSGFTQIVKGHLGVAEHY